MVVRRIQPKARIALPDPSCLLPDTERICGRTVRGSWSFVSHSHRDLALGFAVATYCSVRVHESSWVLASGYCLMFATLVLTGPGKFSIDHLRALRSDKNS